ncbi:MAG TPA: hypothetical protein VFY23_13720 [Candidatus Limnocylindrales bacterium]|nr:hypothetical protein [Candidatus Limnocylindrales bacterium]
MAGRALLLRAEPGFSLPAYERFAPPPPPALVAARLDAFSQPGEIVLDLFGRGGWVARAAIDRQRKGISLESTPLDRLLAEVVLRPPDLRHLDAAIQALGASARRESSLKASIADRYASRCATCDRPVVLDEVTWSADAKDEDGRSRGPVPVRKHYRCPVCRDQLGGGEQRQAPLDATDLARAADPDGLELVDALSARFPVLEGGEDLPRELLGLHTPRQLAAFAAILERIEGDLRAAPIEAALRLALLHALAPASRLATSPGRLAPLRVANGHVRPPGAAQWRERNPWLAFEDGVRLVRGFVQRLESGAWGPVPARLGDDLRSLVEGSASVVLKQGTPAALAGLELETEHLTRHGTRPRIRLVVGTPPLRPVADRLAWAYHGTAWVLGRDAAQTLPLEPLFGPAVRPAWGWQAAAITRSLRGIEAALARDARIVFLLEGDGAESLVATVLGGVTAGYRVAAARLPEAGRENGGLVELVPPGSGAVPGGPRTRANQALTPLPGGAGDPDLAPAERLFAPPERIVNAPFSVHDAQRAVVEAAVDVLKLRGEPVSFAGLLGEILVGLDRAGHLRRLVRPPVAVGEDAAAPPDPVVDHVDRLLALVTEALDGADGRRLARVDDRWWLGDRTDREAAAVPLADRVEWAVYSLLSTSGPLSEAQFLERIANLFTGPDLPDEPLVRACLDSYRSLASTPDRLLTTDDLVRRSTEHGQLIATLVDLGHRLGFSCWIGARQQSRRLDGVALAERLDEREAAGPPYFGRLRPEELEDVDVIWYVRGRAAFLWEVEWTAMLGEPVLRRHARMAPDDRVVRFCVVLPERASLVRHKLERSPLLRREMDAGSWHLLKSNHLREWAGRERVELADLEALLGLDPAVERTGDQLSLFSG